MTTYDLTKFTLVLEISANMSFSYIKFHINSLLFCVLNESTIIEIYILLYISIYILYLSASLKYIFLKCSISLSDIRFFIK